MRKVRIFKDGTFIQLDVDNASFYVSDADVALINMESERDHLIYQIKNILNKMKEKFGG